MPDVFPGGEGGGPDGKQTPRPVHAGRATATGQVADPQTPLLSTRPRPGTHPGPSLGNEDGPPGADGTGTGVSPEGGRGTVMGRGGSAELRLLVSSPPTAGRTENGSERRLAAGALCGPQRVPRGTPAPGEGVPDALLESHGELKQETHGSEKPRGEDIYSALSPAFVDSLDHGTVLTPTEMLILRTYR